MTTKRPNHHARITTVAKPEPIFKLWRVSQHATPLQEGCDLYVVREGVFRRIKGIRLQAHTQRYIGYFPGNETLQLVEMKSDEQLVMTDRDVDGVAANFKAVLAEVEQQCRSA